MGYRLDEFKFDLRRCTSAPEHIWVGSGYSTCSPQHETVCGMCGVYSPPYSAPDLRLAYQFEANGHLVLDNGNKGKGDCGLLFAGSAWYPHKIERRGTYHFVVDGELLSFYVVSELIPLFNKAGFMQKITVKNRGKDTLDMKISPMLMAGAPRKIDLDHWDFCRPQIGEETAARIDNGVYENAQVRVDFFGGDLFQAQIESGSEATCCFAVVLSSSGENIKHTYNAKKWEEEAVCAWEKKINRAGNNIPCLRTDIPELEDYYKRSLISGLVALWENDKFAMSPIPVTSGIDGGAICFYQWNAGYCAEFLIMMLGNKVFELLDLLINSDIDKHICMSVAGHGQGQFFYASNLWAVIYFYYKIVTMTGKGLEYFDTIKSFFESQEQKRPQWEHLIDYGGQHNMLEMRASGYENFVVSPNSERAWCYKAMSEIAEKAGKDESRWEEKSQKIYDSINQNLWDDEKGWYKSLHDDGAVEYVYSIQVYDAFRFSNVSNAVKEKLLAHLKDGMFLSRFGMNSISREDTIHYETNDPDWSGAGGYVGDGADLARTLWEKGEDELAWNVMKRFFWLGQTLPYYPQEHYCDKPIVPAHKRANDISGSCGMEAILYGMLGIEYSIDNQISFNPSFIPEGTIEVTGIVYKDRQYNILLKQDYFKLYDSNKVYYEGKLQKVVI